MPLNNDFEDPNGELDCFDDITVGSFETPILPN